MNRMLVFLVLLALVSLSACQSQSETDVEEAAYPNAQVASEEPPAVKAIDPFEGESHFANIRQLTFGGENAEAYFSFAGDKLIFQSTRPPYDCDQIFTMNLDGSGLKMVSTGQGRTTCAYFLNDDSRIVYSSTHLGDKACPPKPSFDKGYVWPTYKSYDVFSANPDGTDLVRLTEEAGYDAEATVDPVSGRIIFTSERDGDLDIYSMMPDGTGVTRLTDTVGYDGGAFYSQDGSKICFRAHRLDDPDQIKDFRLLLSEGLIRPTRLDIYVMDSDGTNLKRLTDNGAANFCPYFTPDGERIVFASNLANPRGHTFDLYMINLDGSGLERVTFNDSFDGFPMFSPDGRNFVWASNRHNDEDYETNIFIADWNP